MKKFGFATLAGALVSVLAMASTVLAAAPPAEPSVRFIINAGLTAGGDTIEKLEYETGASAHIKGGGLVQLGAGVQFHRPYSAFSLLTTLNYHVDNATAENGDARFDRMPLELLAFYHLNDRWRIGGGLRHTMNPKFTEKFDGQPRITIDYQDTNSLVLQVGFGSERVWGGLRYVNESFDAERASVGNLSGRYTHTDDGSHVGLLAYYAF